MAKKNKRRILIVDSLNLYFRSLAVNPTLSEKGYHIGGLMGYLKSLQKLVREMKPDEVIVAWDGAGGSQKRRQIKKDYKEGRKPVKRHGYNRAHAERSPEEEEENRLWQMSRLVEYLNMFPVKQLMYDRVEADDIIALAVNSPTYRGCEKIIVSNDKDFMQLLDDETILIRPVTDEILNKKRVVEKHNIHPANMTLARAIAGDPSDNLPGVPGVGLKTAVKCFPELSSSYDVMLEEIVDKSKDPPKKWKAYESILENEDVIKLNYKMMQLYSPRVSIETRKSVNKILEEPNGSFNKTEFRKMLTIDGFPEYNWSSMMRQFNKMLIDGINNVFP